MNHKERFRALINFEKVDRIPVYFFGTWSETKVRWKREGCKYVDNIESSAGPQLSEMDPEWEKGLWGHHGLVKLEPVGDIKPEIIEEAEDFYIFRSSTGEITKNSRKGESIPHTLKFALEPNRASWERFKGYLIAGGEKRMAPDWEKRAEKLNNEDRLLLLLGGSLYGHLRNWMGIEAISILMYDDPELFDEMITFMADYYMNSLEPVIKKVNFDFVYLFEDCCGADGPLFSPDIYTRFFTKEYRRLSDFYYSHGIKYIMLDSDGKVDRFIPLWLEDGINVFFPLEVGKWNATPEKMRNEFGRKLWFFGGIDKHMIVKDRETLVSYLSSLKPSYNEAAFCPAPTTGYSLTAATGSS